MRRNKRLTRMIFLFGSVVSAAVMLAAVPVRAQIYDCPAGYYYIENYGCAPLAYYQNPSIPLPDLGFGFFYGGGWRGGYRGGGGWHGGGGFRGGFQGGGFHGGGFRGGGFRGGGGFHGGGHGGGRR